MQDTRPDQGTPQRGRRIVGAAPCGDSISEHFADVAPQADSRFMRTETWVRGVPMLRIGAVGMGMRSDPFGDRGGR
jgi:hypothetical protein